MYFLIVKCYNPKKVFWWIGIGIPSVTLIVSDILIYLKVEKLSSIGSNQNGI